MNERFPQAKKVEPGELTPQQQEFVDSVHTDFELSDFEPPTERDFTVSGYTENVKPNPEQDSVIDEILASSSTENAKRVKIGGKEVEDLTKLGSQLEGLSPTTDPDNAQVASSPKQDVHNTIGFANSPAGKREAREAAKEQPKKSFLRRLFGG